ncbi:MAG TPA: acyl-CoA dehydrogenase family protein [Acidimicrobiales bacterium]
MGGDRKGDVVAWDFSTDPDFQARLDWMEAFVTEEVEPIDLLWGSKTYHPLDDDLRAIVDPLKQQVRDRGLWACHLGPELGGQGYGQVKLALMNEILGRSSWAPIIFGTQAPDTGNAEIIAHYGTEQQKRDYLQPLLDGEIFSCYSMTEPQGGSDPALFETSAVRDGDEWIINGWKFFSSNARTAAFLIVMVITDHDTDVYHGMSMFLVPTDTPGVTIDRNIGLMGERVPGSGMHALIHYEDVRVPADNLLGGEGQAFAIAQTRLGGGRVHHAMRTVGMARRALDMLCERAVSRRTRTGVLADLQSVRDYVADSHIELTQFRLLVLYVAWCIDQGAEHRSIRRDIAAIKVLTPQVLHNVTQRAIQVYGALGVSDELPLGGLWMTAPIMGLVDGPTEVHRTTVARQVLKGYEPVEGLWPSQHLPTRVAAAREKFADHPGALRSAAGDDGTGVAAALERELGNL